MSLRRLTVMISLSGALLLLLFVMRNIQAQEAGPATQPGTSETGIAGITTTNYYLPVLFQRPPAVTLLPIGRGEPAAGDADTWTLNWNVEDSSEVTGYEIQESQEPNFGSILNTYTTTDESYAVERSPSFNNVYFYRVRANGPWGDGTWSNVAFTIGSYYDEFTNGASNWQMRRQDTDDVENDVRYESGKLIHEMDGRWDYLLSSPLRRAPEPPYRIDLRAELVGVDNLHVYGFAFGGNVDGAPCPAADYSNCFNSYYRVLILWNGNQDFMKVQIKRIEGHDPVDNSGFGTDVLPFTDVPVNNPSAGPQKWSIEVFPDGEMNFFVNDTYLVTVNDTALLDQPFFGAFTATDEYAGLEARYEWYSVDLLSSTRTAADSYDQRIQPADIAPEVPFVWPTGRG